MMDDTMAYVALCRDCGGKVWMSVDAPHTRDVNAEEMAEMVKDDFIIDRVTVDAANDIIWCCKRFGPQRLTGGE